MDKKNGLDKRNFKSMIGLRFPYEPITDFIEKEYSKFLDLLEKMIEDFRVKEQDKSSFKKLGEDIFFEKLNDIIRGLRFSLTIKGKNDFIQSVISCVDGREENDDVLNSIQESINIVIKAHRWTKEEIDNMMKIFNEKIPNFAKKLKLLE
jgi:hypothetical protein